jgi:hypothetical protein
LLTEVTGQTAAVDPLDTGVVANLDVNDLVALCNHNTCTLVTTDERELGRERPVAVHGVQVSVADTRELDVDEDLIGTGLLDVNLLVLNWAAGLLNDHSHLLGGDRRGHVGDVLLVVWWVWWGLLVVGCSNL